MLRAFTMLALSAGVITATALQAHAAAIVDPFNDFIPSYDATAPRAGDLDVVRAQVTLDGDHFILSALFNAPVNTTPEAFYVWGFNRGEGTARFAALGLTDILFDSVIAIQNEGTGVVNDLVGGLPPAMLGAGSTTVTGNLIETVVPIALLASRGFAVADYTWNLWPRFGGVAGTGAISDFAPDATNAGVTAVPEPATILLLGTGLIGLVRQRAARSKHDQAG